MTAKPRRRVPYLVLGIAVAVMAAWLATVRMPGRSHRGVLPPPSAREREIAATLERHVRKLAGEIGERNVLRRSAYEAAAQHVEASFAAAGLAPRRQTFTVRGIACANVWVEIEGTTNASEIVVVGAHYDSVEGCPGANDNASGVAALIVLAAELGRERHPRTLRLVAFANEEPPWFHTEDMGSVHFARACKERGDDVVVMLSLETLGCYSDEEGSQNYPLPLLRAFYPSRGDFVAFVGNVASGSRTREAIATFREHAAFPSEGACLPSWVPGVGWSDQWAFWQEGYRALMVTDTAPFRYAHYHRASDTPEHVDCEKLARVVVGLQHVAESWLER